MRLSKVFLFIVILPLTIFLDLILYGFLKTCPNCGNFGQFLTSEGAISFPLVIGLTQWFSRFLPKMPK